MLRISRHTTRHHSRAERPRLAATARLPLLRARPGVGAPTGWARTQARPYYFDASQQTAKTLKALVRQARAASGDALPVWHRRLAAMTGKLLESLCTHLKDDQQSVNLFNAMLRVHLGKLDAATLQALPELLRATDFCDAVSESVLEGSPYTAHGYPDGAPSPGNRTVLRTGELYALLEETHARHAAAEAALTTLPQGWAQAARDALAQCALAWRPQLNARLQLTDAASRLGGTLALPRLAEGLCWTDGGSRHSTMQWLDGKLTVDGPSANRLAHDEATLATLLRDLLELVLAVALYGKGDTAGLSATERHVVLHALEQACDARGPAATGNDMRRLAAGVLQRSLGFGQVQLYPVVGSHAGHAWIAPNLSLMPDRRTGEKFDVGTRFMQAGFHSAPVMVNVSERPLQFIDASQNQTLFPDQGALQVTVAVDATRLQAAAIETMQAWQRDGLRYRMFGVSPGMPAQGCRSIVWQVVRHGMEPDARQLFAHFNRGLPEPESTTELWLRLEGFMEWMHKLAGNAVGL